MKIKSFLITVVLATAILCFGINPGTVKAACSAGNEIICQINELLDKIKALQAQIAQLQAQQTTPIAWCHTFNTNLRIGDSGSEIADLIKVLSTEGVLKLDNVVEKYSFDEVLASAVAGLQEKYASEILAPYHLTHGTGFVGISTRAKLNALYGCGQTSTPTPTTTQSVFPLKSYFAPTVGTLNSAFEVKCDFGMRLPCITAKHGNSACTYLKFDGASAVFKCTPTAEGTIDNYCNIFNYSADSKCVAQTNQINSTTVSSSATQPSITVTSPKTGDVYKPGDVMNIKWQLTGSPLASEKLNISIKNFSGSGDANISGISAMLNGSLYSYTVPTTFLPGDRYRLAVSGLVGGVPVTGNSDYFSIVASTTACTDSDGGKDYYVKGTLNGYYNGSPITLSDFCIDRTNSENGEIVTQCSGSKCQIGERVCNSSDSVDYATTYYTCPNGCENGACKQAITQPSITVLSPNGGEIIVLGTPTTISWSGGPFSSQVTAALFSGNSTLSNRTQIGFIGNSTQGASSLTWDGRTVCPYGTSGSQCFTVSPGQYKIYLTAFVGDGNNVAEDLSNNYFTIAVASTQPSITVTSPNGGEALMQGQTYEIKWQSTDIPSDSAISIQLSYILVGNFSPYESVIFPIGTNVVKNTGNYNWTIPTDNFAIHTPWSKIQNNKYLIRVIYSDPTTGRVKAENYSDNYFSIVAPTVGINISDSLLASISDAIARIIQGIQELLGR